MARIKAGRTTISVKGPESVIADGNHSAVFEVSVTTDSKVRSGDLMQCWIVKGEGKLRPQWFFLDENGEAQITFIPNALTRYSDNPAELAIRDTSIGRIIETGKEVIITVDLLEAEKE